jgi:hypothetical protein
MPDGAHPSAILILLISVLFAGFISNSEILVFAMIIP